MTKSTEPASKPTRSLSIVIDQHNRATIEQTGIEIPADQFVLLLLVAQELGRALGLALMWVNTGSPTSKLVIAQSQPGMR